MKVIGSIIMYSGMPDPAAELDEATVKEITNRLFYLEERCDNIFNGLGFRGYSVLWNPEVENAPWVRVQAHNGVVEISCFGVRSAYKDNVELEDFLARTMAPVWQKHIEEGMEAMRKYNEEMFGIPTEEKV